MRQAGAIGTTPAGNWLYEGQTGTLGFTPAARTVTEHPAPRGSAVAVERVEPTVPGSAYLIARQLAIRDGGAERVIYRTSGAGFYWSGWSPDAKYVALWEIDQFSGSIDMDGRPLVVIDVESGKRVELGKTLLYSTTAWTSPHTLAYIAGASRVVWETKALRLWSPAKGITTVTPPDVAAFAPVWAADGQHLYFVSGPSGGWDPLAAGNGRGVGDRHITVYDAATNAMRSLPHAAGYVEEGVRPSRDGTRLLVLRRQTVSAADIRTMPSADLEVWLMDQSGGNGTALVRFPHYALGDYGYYSGPAEWMWSE